MISGEKQPELTLTLVGKPRLVSRLVSCRLIAQPRDVAGTRQSRFKRDLLPQDQDGHSFVDCPPAVSSDEKAYTLFVAPVAAGVGFAWKAHGCRLSSSEGAMVPAASSRLSFIFFPEAHTIHSRASQCGAVE